MFLRISLTFSLFLLISASKTLSIPSSATSLALTLPDELRKRTLSSAPRDASLQVRQPMVYPGWHFAFYDPVLEMWIPIMIGRVIGLAVMGHLLSDIIDSSLNKWARSPPSNQVVIEAGDMRLEFGCTMREPVPWEFVAEFAKSRRDAVERGFAPAFAREWWVEREGKGRVCYVGIRVVGDGGEVVRPEQDGWFG